MIREGSFCPICGKAKLTKRVRNEKFMTPMAVGLKEMIRFVVPNYTTYECSHCKDGLVSSKSLRDITKYFKKAKGDGV